MLPGIFQYMMKLINALFNFLRNLPSLVKNAVFPEIRALGEKIYFLEKENLELMRVLDSIDKNYLLEIDKKHLIAHYQYFTGKNLDLENVRTFNEKLQWLKLYRRDPVMTVMSDKYRVRDFLRERGYGQYLNDLYGVYNCTDELIKDLPKLPEKFVVKANHGSGGVLRVKNKNRINMKKLRALDKRLRSNYYCRVRGGKKNGEFLFSRNCEWNYRDIEPCLIVERYLEDGKGGLFDYKIFCFNGVPSIIQVDIDRYGNHTKCFYDTEWNRLSFTIKDPLYKGDIPRPSSLHEMMKFAENISKGFPYLRVDLYNIDDKKIIFGELTFYHLSGFGRFMPEEWDLKLGEMIDLNYGGLFE